MSKREERTALIAKARELERTAKAEDRDLTDEELVEVNTALDQAEALGPEIKAEEASAQERTRTAERLEAAQATLDAPLPRRVRDVPVPPAPEADAGIIDALAERFATASAGGPEWLKDPTFGYRDIGQFALAVRLHDHPSNPADPRLVVINRFAEATGMNVGTPSEGGALLAPQFSSSIWTGMQQVPDNLMGRCDQYTIDGESLTLPASAETSRKTGARWGGIHGYWKAEASKMADSMPTLRELKLEPQELYVFAFVTDKLLRNTTALNQYLNRAAVEEIMFLVNDAIVEGTGAGQPMGFAKSPCLVVIAKESAQPAATVVTQNINKMYARVPARFRSRAVWLHNQDIEPALGEMEAGSGGIPMFYPAGSIAGAPFATLKGLPLVPIEYAETLGDQGDLTLAVMQGYALGVRGSLQSAMSIHLRFDYNESAFRFIFEVDGRPWPNKPLTPFKGTAKQSPFVTLAARA